MFIGLSSITCPSLYHYVSQSPGAKVSLTRHPSVLELTFENFYNLIWEYLRILESCPSLFFATEKYGYL